MPKLFLIMLIVLLLGSMSQGELVTAELIAARCKQWIPLIERCQEYWYVDTDLVLAVMAKESTCDRTATDGVSIGLMQVTPSSWTTTADRLYSANVNIYWGMYILHHTINDPENNPDKSIARGLAAYNCGWTSLDANACIPTGGYEYAKQVILFWLPVTQGDLTWDKYEAYNKQMGSARQEAPEETTWYAHPR